MNKLSLISGASPLDLWHRTRMAAFFALFTILLAIPMLIVLQPYPFDHNFPKLIDSPGLALQLSSDAQDLRVVLDRGNEKQNALARQVLRTNNRLDLLFIPLYTGFLSSFIFIFREVPGTRLLRLLAWGTIAAAAVFDYLEDFGIFRTLDSLTLSDGLARGISFPSHLKWGFFGAALFLIGVLLFQAEGHVYSRATLRIQAILFSLAGLFIFLGLWAPSTIESGINFFVVCVVWNAVALLGPPLARRFPGIRPHYIDDFCGKARAKDATSVTLAPATPRLED